MKKKGVIICLLLCVGIIGCRREERIIRESETELVDTGETQPVNESASNSIQDTEESAAEPETETDVKQNEDSVGAIVTADVSSFPEAEIIKMSDDGNIEFIFTADCTLTDLRFFNIYNDGDEQEINRLIHETPVFQEGSSYLIDAHINSISNIAVSYIGPDGSSSASVIALDNAGNDVGLEQIEELDFNEAKYRKRGHVSVRQEISLDGYDDIIELDLDGQDGYDNFVFSSESTLYDLALYRTEILDFEAEEINYHLGEICYETDTFETSSALHITAYLPETFPNLLVTYRDEDDNVLYFNVILNLRYGGVSLKEVEEDMVK